MADDRWWRGFDELILDSVPPAARILDIGCGDGGLVARLRAEGLEAVGVDPRAPTGPHFIQGKVENVADIGEFDAVSAVMSLHHAPLEPVLAAIARLLKAQGSLFVCEMAWDAYDERAAAWLRARDPSDTDHSVSRWDAEHSDLHRGDTMRAAIMRSIEIHEDVSRPFLARLLGRLDLEEEEQAAIEAGALPVLGRWYFGRLP